MRRTLARVTEAAFTGRDRWAALAAARGVDGKSRASRLDFRCGSGDQDTRVGAAVRCRRRLRIINIHERPFAGRAKGDEVKRPRLAGLIALLAMLLAVACAATATAGPK